MLGAGIHTLTAEDYHRDPCPEPALSAGLAHTLLTRSPKHAWTESRRLNPDYRERERDSFDLGSAAHDIFLEGGDKVAVITGFDDWRKKEAKEIRQATRDVGRIPILEKDWQRVVEMLTAMRQQLDARADDPPLFAEGGKAEQTVLWQERGVWCRALVDWLNVERGTICDLKTTSASANPLAWTRTTMWNIGADVQLAMHSRGVQAVTGKPALMRYCVVESAPPFALSVVTLAPAALEFANAKVDQAIDTWRECLASETWPMYTRELCHAEPPPWEESRWLERQAIEEMEAAA